MPVALITGASRGFGRAVAHDLAAAGWSLVLDARGADDLAAAGAGLVPARTRLLPGDVRHGAHREDLVAGAWDLGGIDLLVNNASHLGPSPQPRLADYEPRDLATVYDVDVLAPHALLREALPQLRRSAGIVVNVSSDAAVVAYEGWGGYGSAKAALDQLSAVLAVEEPDLRVYALDPGDMRTDMHQQAYPGEDISDRPEPGTGAVPESGGGLAPKNATASGATKDRHVASVRKRPARKPGDDKPPSAKASYLLTLARVKELYRTRQYELALVEIGELDRQYPDDEHILSMKGSLYERLGNKNLAREAWQQTLRINPYNLAVLEALQRLGK